MMSLNERLKQKLNQRGITVTNKTIDFFINKPTPIFKDDIYFNHLSLIIKQFHLDKYGKQIESIEIIKSTIKAIRRDFSHLATVEIGYCTKRVIDGEDEVNNYLFNTSDLIKVIRRYDSKKKAVKDTYYMSLNDEKEKAEGKQLREEFLQKAMSKMDRKEDLTVYEKSAIGKHYINDFSSEDLVAIKELVDQELPKLKKILNAKRMGSLESLTNDPDMNTPLMWTEPLLFNNKLFNALKF